MSLWREAAFTFIVKEEYRYFFKTVIMENNLDYTYDNKIITSFLKQLEPFNSYYLRFLNIVKPIVIDGQELPIYNENTGECSMFIAYNMHNGIISRLLRAFFDELLSLIAEDGKIKYLHDWNELDS